MKHHLSLELKRALSLKKVIIWLLILLVPSFIQFSIVSNGYVFYRPIEVFQEMISNFIPLLFPLFMLVIYSNSIAVERHSNYLLYTRTRIWLPTYLTSKVIVNAIYAFVFSFLLVIIPFIFVFYIEPLLNIIHYEPIGGNTISSSTFDQYLEFGNFTYIGIYGLWVAINGVIYSTLALLLTLCITNPFLALSLPFVWYQVMNFVTAVFGLSYFSPVSTIFPFNIVQQDIWTVFVPFGALCLFIGIIVIYLIKYPEKWKI